MQVHGHKSSTLPLQMAQSLAKVHGTILCSQVKKVMRKLVGSDRPFIKKLDLMCKKAWTEERTLKNFWELNCI